MALSGIKLKIISQTDLPRPVEASFKDKWIKKKKNLCSTTNGKATKKL